MRLHGTMQINENGHLMIGGCDTVELAREFGTPLLIIDEAEVRRRCFEYRTVFRGTGIEAETIYASKAFLTMALCRILKEEGLGLDVVSGGELFIAQSAGFPMDRVYFHGNNKTPEEIKQALEAGIGRFVVDNMQELQLLNYLAEEQGVTANVLFRVTPGIEAHTHEYIQTGQSDSKFGLGLANGIAMEVIRIASRLPRINICGLHCHIGSQIFNLESFRKAGEVMMDFCNEIRRELGIEIRELNLGGGIGIPYTEKDPEVSIRDYALIVADTLKKKAFQLNLPLPKVINEPGRYIIGPAGTTLYTIGVIKEIPGIRTYLSVDGGMTDNIRPALYNARYEAIVTNKAFKDPIKTVTVVGRCCESGDMLIHDLKIPEVEPGDILAVFCTGAYTYSMASNYNGLPRIAVVLVNDGEAEVIVRRETYRDLISRDQIPARLNL
ncbi:diaminopimelate decarboxylase [Anoxybacter fermentans]|uniref:Diaminopimelate decarboxylase n=1 Tax=Anoxybacter fermentans TaxID=1323375 RepID=A0A3Q9HUG7_9FIRM|nr:diaminopimelate decarboxylase [Anoxybacter fermentans]AZR74652.1 diaminopimelate decarboxylase [Anoxybacter fermentans]